MTINPLASFTSQLKQQAYDLGFVLCGVTPAAAPRRLEALHRWLAAGYAGEMDYIPARRAAYADPRIVLEGCRSIAMLALPYFSEPSNLHQEQERQCGKVARYALGELDYHDVIHSRLKKLQAWMLAGQPRARVRGVVDTAPLLERELAEAAGLGWVGKNTLLLNRKWGSYFFLAALLTDLELSCDPPSEKSYCGTCTACLDACPTKAFPEPFVLDATKCISYLTIEHRSHIGDELKHELDGWVFGCDICQEVCPWNRKAPAAQETVFQPRPDLLEFDILLVLQMTDEQFRQRYRRTPLWRAKRRGIVRNALLIAGRRQMQEAYSEICRLLDDEEPLIRDAAAWAVQQFDLPDPIARSAR